MQDFSASRDMPPPPPPPPHRYPFRPRNQYYVHNERNQGVFGRNTCNPYQLNNSNQENTKLPPEVLTFHPSNHSELRRSQRDIRDMPPPPPPHRYPFRPRNQCYVHNERNQDVIGRNIHRPSQLNNSMKESTELATELLTFHPSNHGELRRGQRDIGVRDLQAAKKYGKRRRGRTLKDGATTTMYDYRGIRYIENNVTKKEITSYNLTTNLDKKKITRLDNEKHNQALEKINKDHSSWESHTVCVVDTSGSMRQSDVKGSRNRLEAVWLSLAIDFVQHRIESGEATDMCVFTVITMGEEAKVIIDQQPTDWILFNKLADLFHGQSKEKVWPRGHGFFLPALNAAEKILSKNSYSSCALTLAILTDGRPSDFIQDKNEDISTKTKIENNNLCIQHKIEDLSSRMGKRLTVACVGIGSADQFKTLVQMKDSANDFGSVGTCLVPSMTTSCLREAMTSIATTLATRQTEINHERNNGKIRNILRERISTVPLMTEEIDQSEFDIYTGDNVIQKVYDPNVEGCFKDTSLQHTDAAGVAICKKAFGEGTERIVYQFFEVGSDYKTVVGNSLVAKESRFLEDVEKDKISKEKYVRKFCGLQYKARMVANAFNEKLDNLKILDKNTARVSFLDCSVYSLQDKKIGEKLLLVERKLDQKFQKWNNNNGAFLESNNKLDKGHELITIEDSDDEEGNENFTAVSTILISPSEVAQAFSHFSHYHSGEKSLICDLQGSYDNLHNMFRFTDPVIHYYDKQNDKKTNVYGRTDLGRNGINSFLETHTCNELCKLLTKGWKDVRPSKKPRRCRKLVLGETH